MTNISTILAAVERAESSGETDDDAETIRQQLALCKAIRDVILFATQRKVNVLAHDEIVDCLSTTLGLYIKQNAVDRAAAMFVAGQVLDRIIGIQFAKGV